MTTADLDAILRLELALFGDEAWSRQMLAGELGQQPASRHYVVAEDDGQIVGYAGLLAAGGQADVLTIAVLSGAGAPRCSWRSGPITPARSGCTSGGGSPRSASGGATTSRRAPMRS